MKRAARKNRGQLVIIAALLIAVLTLSLAASIHELSLRQQELSYSPVQELVLGVSGDFERALNHALNVASHAYNSTGQKKSAADAEGTTFLAYWTRSVLTAYSNTGLTVNVTSSSFNFIWYSNDVTAEEADGKASSYCSSSFSLDAPSYGFQGYIGQSQKDVRLFIETVDVTNSSRTSLKFNVTESSGGSQDLPIPNLTQQNLFINRSSAEGLPRDSWPGADITSLTYLGNGEYNVTFTPSVNTDTKGVILSVVTPQEGIMVKACYERPPIATVTLQSMETDSPAPTLNKGRIQFGDRNYSLPITMVASNGTYILRYFPDPGYTFVNWGVVNGDATISDSFLNNTLVEIYHNSTIAAVYRSTVNPAATVGLSSRALDGSSSNFGSITFNSTAYTLANTTGYVPFGDYAIQFDPPAGMYFVRWESDGVIPFSSSDNPTTLRVSGSGNLVAVYSSNLEPPSSITVALQSREESGASANLGSIQLGSQTYSPLPNSTSVMLGSYLLDYSPAGNYVFVRWEVTSVDIVLDNAGSKMTQASVNGNETITAVYRSSSVQPIYTVALRSRALDGSSQNLGRIVFGSGSYTLPNATNVQLADYALAYSSYNATFIFLQWESTGSVLPWNSSDSSTLVTVLGNGTITAVYGPAPFNGEGDALYVDNNNELNTNGDLSDKWWKGGYGAKLSANFSSANQEIDSASDPLPMFYVASVIRVTTYVELSQGQNAKNVVLTVGFSYNGWFYQLGSGTFPVASQTVGIYTLDINAFNEGNWTSQYGSGVIPAGSVFYLRVNVFFDRSPYGTMFLRYGKDFPSQIQFL